MYTANPAYPLFGEIQNIVKKHLGIDKVIKNVIERLGDLEKVYLTGSFAEGRDGEIIDLVLIGEVEIEYLTNLIDKAEKLVNRKIRYVHYGSKEWKKDILESFSGNPLLIWQKGIAI